MAIIMKKMIFKRRSAVYFWEKITSNTRGVCKAIVDVHDELAILAKRQKQLIGESEAIGHRWEFIERSCKYNSKNWSMEKIKKTPGAGGLSGPCQHPKQPQKSLIGNCFPANCPLEVGEEKGDI
jgi:hypothetical protein